MAIAEQPGEQPVGSNGTDDPLLVDPEDLERWWGNLDPFRDDQEALTLHGKVAQRLGRMVTTAALAAIDIAEDRWPRVEAELLGRSVRRLEDQIHWNTLAMVAPGSETEPFGEELAGYSALGVAGWFETPEVPDLDLRVGHWGSPAIPEAERPEYRADFVIGTGESAQRYRIRPSGRVLRYQPSEADDAQGTYLAIETSELASVARVLIQHRRYHESPRTEAVPDEEPVLPPSAERWWDTPDPYESDGSLVSAVIDRLVERIGTLERPDDEVLEPEIDAVQHLAGTAAVVGFGVVRALDIRSHYQSIQELRLAREEREVSRQIFHNAQEIVDSHRSPEDHRQVNTTESGALREVWLNSHSPTDFAIAIKLTDWGSGAIAPEERPDYRAEITLSQGHPGEVRAFRIAADGTIHSYDATAPNQESLTKPDIEDLYLLLNVVEGYNQL